MSDSSSVFVGNLSDRVRYHDIENFFKDFGKLNDITLKVNSICFKLSSSKRKPRAATDLSSFEPI